MEGGGDDKSAPTHARELAAQRTTRGRPIQNTISTSGQLIMNDKNVPWFFLIILLIYPLQIIISLI